MRDPQVRVEYPLLIEILDLIPACFQLADGSGLLSLLEGMGVDRPGPRGRQVSDRLPEGIGRAQDEPGVEQIADPAISGAVIALADLDGLCQHCIGIPPQPRGSRSVPSSIRHIPA